MTRTDGIPPHDLTAERSLLGGILRDPEVFDSVAATIQAEAFYLDAHQRVWRALAGLVADQSPIDLVTVHDRLRRTGDPADIGGPTYLAELWDSAANGANAEYHADIVAGLAKVRGLIRVASEVLRDSYSQCLPPAELIARTERAVFALADSGRQNSPPRSAAELLPEALQRIDDRIAAGGKLDGLATGLDDLDALLGGLRAGQLIVIGARPSVGKSALVLSVAVNVATAGTPALLFSMEMPQSEVSERLLSMGSGVPMSRFTRCTSLNQSEVDRLTGATGPTVFGRLPLWVADSPEQNAARIASVTRQMVRRHGIGLMVVDYLQLMSPENSRDNRALQVGLMARRLKQLARECGIPIVLLSQLNREVEHRGDGRPRLADLRESGDIEAHADAVILLHRPQDQDQSQSRILIEAMVRKNRNGPTGDVSLCFQQPITRFANMVK